MTAPAQVLLPEGTRLVHIGPHKTGTSALQGAFHLARGAASKQGVHYAGPNRQPLHAARQVAALTDSTAGARGELRQWARLVREIRSAAEPRILVSSEWFADAKEPGIRRIAHDLGPDQTHIVVTLRPLVRILASQWQQHAQAGHPAGFEPWLRTVFTEPESTMGRVFWHRHRHDRLVERWAGVVGLDRITVVVADDHDRDFLLRAFEGLTGLRTGTLSALDDHQNRSLTVAEIELVRRLHGALARAGIDPATRLKLMLFGAALRLRLRVPGPLEPRIEAPAWAVEDSTAIAQEIVRNLGQCGVRVIGNLSSLAAAPPDAGKASDGIGDPDWSALAAAAAMGVLGFSGLARGRRPAGAAAWPDAAPPRRAAAPLDMDAIGAVSTPRLVAVFAARIRGAVRSRLPWKPAGGGRLARRGQAG